MADSNFGLIVPVNVTALCVGIKDQQDPDGTSKFAGATTSYINQMGIYDAFLGSNVVRTLVEAPLHQLKKGIHIHWALPSSLSQGNFDPGTNTSSFVATPNRWLISRMIITDGQPSRTTWVIESDALTVPGSQQDDVLITLPVRQLTPSDTDYQYVGKPVVFSSEWTEPNNSEVFKNLTGQALSAVANGDSTFAAFYPNCRNVFGFYDALESYKGPVQIMYQVLGWYSVSEDDPLHGGLTNEQLQDILGWTFEDSQEVPGYSTYYGLTQSVQWDENRSYIVDAGNNDIEVTATIGNNPPETFSAYFKERIHPGIDFFEDLLNAFQTGILPIFREPAAGQLALLQQVLHGKQFNPTDAGNIYMVVRKPDDDNINDPSAESPVTDLPLQLGIALNQLNIYQQQVDYFTTYIDQYKSQLFANWYRLMKAEGDDEKNDLYLLLQEQINVYTNQLEDTLQRLQTNLTDQLEVVNDQIAALNTERDIVPVLELKITAVNKYWQPNEPVILLTAPSFEGTLRFEELEINTESEGWLLCRVTNQVLTALAIEGTGIPASDFNSILLPQPNHLPYAALSDQLLQEACLLNTSIAGKITGLDVALLEENLKLALQRRDQSVYTFTGIPPILKAVQWWDENPWNPILTGWEARFSPLQPTRQDGEIKEYNPNFFTNNYTVNQDEGGFITYKGATDPEQVIRFGQEIYTGSAILSSSAALAFGKQLAGYLAVHPDNTLQEILDDLATGKYLSFPLSGLNAGLLMKEDELQLNIKVPESNPYYFITESVSEIVGEAYNISPRPNGHFNPLRAGYMDVAFFVVDVYGRKRSLKIQQQVNASSMVSYFNGQQIKDVIFVPPRLSQPARLNFRWISNADSSGFQEMNVQPATTPVCGWIVPNHLDESLFFYDELGKALGSIYLDGNHSKVLWLSAPGNNQTIGKSLQEVFQYEDPVLSDLANALMENGPGFFSSFWKAIDDMHNFVNPSNFSQNNDLAVLIGRPVAVTQALLRLEIAGGSQVNQAWNTIDPNNNNYTGVQFPVILGDLENINDGLIGYFKEGTSGYDFGNFYCEAAVSENGVQKPGPKNILITPSPALMSDSYEDISKGSMKILMLVDPRAAIYATSGIQPICKLEIPANQYVDVISTLEMTFLASPVLRGVTGMNIPLAKEEGYQWSWVEEDSLGNQPLWTTVAGLKFNTNEAIAAYTPQTIREGWLKLTPQILSFSLLNSAGQPTAVPGQENTFVLTMKNEKSNQLKFIPGQLLPEGVPNNGAAFFIHFGTLVPEDRVAGIQPSADGWDFKAVTDQRFGNYWVATPKEGLILDKGAFVSFNLARVYVAANEGEIQVQVYVDFINIQGVNDGTDASLITLTS